MDLVTTGFGLKWEFVELLHLRHFSHHAPRSTRSTPEGVVEQVAQWRKCNDFKSLPRWLSTWRKSGARWRRVAQTQSSGGRFAHSPTTTKGRCLRLSSCFISIFSAPLSFQVFSMCLIFALSFSSSTSTPSASATA